jgi:beta-lactamase superfamily II metal-dependent hydrolase
MQIETAFLVTRDSQGQAGIGDCIVIIFDENFNPPENRKATIVVDGGYSKTSSYIKNYLQNEGIQIIDLMVATHVDDDHISGLNAFIKDYVLYKNLFEIRNYWGPAPKGYESLSTTEFISLVLKSANTQINEMSFIAESVNRNEELLANVREAVAQENILHPSVATKNYIPQPFKSVKLDILAPDKQIPAEEIIGQRAAQADLENTISFASGIDLADKKWENLMNAAALENNRTANNQSIVFKLTPLDENSEPIEEFSLLFTGDAEEESWEEIIHSSGNEIRSKFLKISHHGSRTGTNINILEKVKPKYGIICSGRNKHGLPDEDVLKLIHEKNIEIYCTGRNPKTQESPCAPQHIRNQCSRWDCQNQKEIKAPIIISIDTTLMTYTINAQHCTVNW